jgi:hypothetical protein
MSKKVNLLVCFVLVLGLGSNVLALDRVQPDFAGGEQSCAVLWEFEDGNSATDKVSDTPSLILYDLEPPDACFGFRYDGFSWEGANDPNLAWVWDSNATVVVIEEESVIQPIPEGEGRNLTVQAQVMWWPGVNTPNGPGGETYLAFLIETWVGKGVERDMFAGADMYAMDGIGNEEGFIEIRPIAEVNIAPGWKHSTYSHTFENFRSEEDITHVHILAFGYEHGTTGLKIDEIVVDMVVHDGATPPTGPGREWLLVPRAGQVRKPDPANRAEHIQPNTNLAWAPDPCLAGPLTYDVYFGLDSNMANNPKIASNIGSNTVDPCSGGDLAAATLFYWRVDTNDAGTVHTGIDFKFTTWGLADDLYPVDGASEIPPPVLLQWGPDGYATSCDVYFGTSFAEVNDATTSSAAWKGNQAVSDANYNTGMLDLLKPHYWRIDEKNGGGTAVKGAVWEFETGPYFEVENFDRYANQAALWNVWDDYWTNLTGSEVFVERDANFTRDGNSLKYLYDCGTDYKKVGARIDADIADMLIGGDWTIAGIKSMVLYFYGDPCNSATSNDRMWVQLEDTSSNAGTKLYGDGGGEDPNDVKLAQWTEWNVDLNDANFSGVSLANVDKIHIGFGGVPIGQSKAGGTGTLYFEDIRLHPQRCRTELVAWDIAGDDCITDGFDIQLMSDDWLIKDYQVFPVPPDRNDLLVEYLFATDGNYNDTSGNGRNGQPSATLTHVANGYLTIENTGGYVDILFGADNPFHGPNDFSIFINYRLSTEGITGLMSSTDPCLPTDWDDPNVNVDLAFETFSPMLLFQEQAAGKATDDIAFYYDNFFKAGTDVATSEVGGIGAWHSVAATYDADGGTDANGVTGLLTVYLDGTKGAGPANFDPNIPQDANYDVVRIGDAYNSLHKEDMGLATHIGDFNEILIYDVALTEGEVYYLSGIIVPTYVANTSLANVVLKSPPGGPYDANNMDIVNLLDFNFLGEHWLEAPLLWP